MLRIQIGHILHRLLTEQQRIEETDEQALVHYRTEKQLEAEIGIGVHVFVLYTFCSHSEVF